MNFTRLHTRFEFGWPLSDQVIKTHHYGQHNNNGEQKSASSTFFDIAKLLVHSIDIFSFSLFSTDRFRTASSLQQLVAARIA